MRKENCPAKLNVYIHIEYNTIASQIFATIIDLNEFRMKKIKYAIQ